MAREINYDPSINLAAGYNTVTQDTDSAHTPPLRPVDGKNLLNFIYWALYTFDGRKFMRDRKPVNGDLSATHRDEMVAKLAEYKVTNPGRVSALLNAHIHADMFAQAFKQDQVATSDAQKAALAAEMDLREKAYLQNMSFVTWALWEDAKDHEFSMGW